MSSEPAARNFEWPTVGEKFNWAIDWFDAIARGNDTTALWIVEEDGSEAKYSFDDMARRSDQVARWLELQGIGRGDSVILMLGNQVELWESMLAVMKLGAVLMPTTTAIGPFYKQCQAHSDMDNPPDAMVPVPPDGAFTSRGL